MSLVAPSSRLRSLISFPWTRRALARGSILRTNSSYLPPSAFVALKTHLSSAYTSGFYLKAPPPAEGEAAPPPPNPLTDPGAMDGMMDMVKKQAVGFLPQVRRRRFVDRCWRAVRGLRRGPKATVCF